MCCICNRTARCAHLQPIPCRCWSRRKVRWASRKSLQIASHRAREKWRCHRCSRLDCVCIRHTVEIRKRRRDHRSGRENIDALSIVREGTFTIRTCGRTHRNCSQRSSWCRATRRHSNAIFITVASGGNHDDTFIHDVGDCSIYG